MPKLSSSNIIEINLPSGTPDDPAIVKFDTTLTTRQALEISKAEDKTEAMVSLIAGCIREWNFTGEDGEVVEITEDNVGHLHLEDFTVLAEKLSESIDSTLGKKNVGLAEKKV